MKSRHVGVARMKSLCLLAALLASQPAMAAMAAERRPAPEAETISLFNGKDLSGWTAFLGKPGVTVSSPAQIGKAYSVKDGVLHVAGAPQGYLRTVNKYTSYQLLMEWRWSVRAPPIPNVSGILLRVGSPDRLWPMTYEVELSEYRDANYRDLSDVGDVLILGYDKAGFKSDPALVNSLGPPDGTIGFSFKDFHRVRSVDAEKPIGEWNSYDITFDGDRLTVKLNGVVVNEGTGAEVVPGYIALQSEGSAVDFRNIRLRPISH